jgi:hypothetical protein
MFVRSVKGSNGQHEYLRLVENYREGHKTRQRVVLHIGRKDLLAPHLDALVRLLQADQPHPAWVSSDQVSAPKVGPGASVGSPPPVRFPGLGALLDESAKPCRHRHPSRSASFR